MKNALSRSVGRRGANRRIFWAIVFALLATAISNVGSAGIISANDPTVSNVGMTGTGNVTIDTNTGLAWLDLTITQWVPYNHIASRFGPGEEFAGYRYATTSELTNFWRNAGVNVDFAQERSAP